METFPARARKLLPTPIHSGVGGTLPPADRNSTFPSLVHILEDFGGNHCKSTGSTFLESYFWKNKKHTCSFIPHLRVSMAGKLCPLELMHVSNLVILKANPRENIGAGGTPEMVTESRRECGGK